MRNFIAVGALTLLLVGGLGAGKLDVEVTAPPTELKDIAINECITFAARAVGGDIKEGDTVWYDYSDAGKPGSGAYDYRIRWVTNGGYLTEIYSPQVGFFSGDSGECNVIAKFDGAVPVDEAGVRDVETAGAGNFEEEKRAAEASDERDAKVIHLRRAVMAHAGDAGNILLEFEIGELLGEMEDMKHQEYAMPLESLKVFEGILGRYDHRKYYEKEMPVTPWTRELMVPRAGILAASVETGKLQDGVKARKYLDMALDDLAWTMEKRRGDWMGEAKPVEPVKPFDSELEQMKWRGRVKAWETKRRDAEANEVLSQFEMDIVRAAVRQYGLSFGKQTSAEVEKNMRVLITRYPHTAIATIAQAHIDRAKWGKWRGG